MEAKQTPLSEQDMAFVSDTSAALMLATPRGARFLLWSIFAFLICALVWAYFAQIDEVTVGAGKVIPSRHLQVIQNLEGGIVAEIYVAEGEQVAPGQPLVRLDDTQHRTSFRENQQARGNLEVMVARLKDEAALPKAIDVDQLERLHELSSHTPNLAALNDKFPTLVRSESEVLEGRIRNLQAGLQVLSDQRGQAKTELNSLKSKVASLTTSYQLAREELELKRPLVEEGVVSRIEFLQDRRKVNDLKGELDGTRFAISKAAKQIEELEQKRLELVAKFRSDALNEQRLSAAELDQLGESKVGLEDRVNRTLVTSPVKGTIQKIHVTTVGGVVQPGMMLMEIVPLEGVLQVEAKIKPEDIAFIRPGLNAVVKLTAYDFAIYGGLAGKVVHVSPDTVIDEEGNSFYIARVETAQTHLGPADKPLPIIPGMLTSVDIMTGKKSVLDYLLKPINRARANAFRER
ncbi:HlyD family type I secretion periplasmic adaptor subunit [Marinobacterium sp. CAU 1594]|nr:HlyD family type I secretion periplasmic adaptor subunit [Marinobacterium arenosum]